MGKMKLIGNAVDMSRTPPTIHQPPPVLGEHTEEVLNALGYDAASISSLRIKRNHLIYALSRFRSLLKILRSSFENLRTNGGAVEIIGDFPFMLSRVEHS